MARKKLPRWCKEAKKALIDRDMTVSDLADKIGVSRTYVSGVINRSVIAEEIAKLISKELGIDDIPY